MKPHVVFAALSAGLVLAACSQPLATSVSAQKAAAISAVVGAVDTTNYLATLGLFVNNRNMARNPAEVAAVESAMEADFTGWGYDVTLQPVTIPFLIDYDILTGQSYLYEGPFTMHNILAKKPGADPSLAPVLVGAHHDTIYRAPGANDNGTGCSAVLEMAWALRNSTLDRTVIFASFAFEEDGLVGSHHYVDGLSDSELPDSTIIFDTIGYTAPLQMTVAGADVLLDMPHRGDFVGAFASSQSRALLLDFLSSAGRDVSTLPVYSVSVDEGLANNPLLQDVLRSDHTWFWVRKAPALFLTDTGNLRVGTPYHTADDDLTRVDIAFATKVTQAALSTVCVRAGLR